MSKNFCGKTCANCTLKEELRCPGCLAGPGRQHYEDCELAKCCREKGHESCETCNFKSSCRMVANCESIPYSRKRKLEVAAEKNAITAKNAPVLGRYLWLLFWMIIPNVISGILTLDVIANWYPKVSLAGDILGAICGVAYGIILLQLIRVDDQYKIAGICTVTAAALTGISDLITGTGNPESGLLLLLLPAAVIALAGEYNEFMAHSFALKDAGNELSEKWKTLWKWNIRSYGILIASMILVFILPIIGFLAAIGAAIALFAIGIMKLMYLYESAKLFREYSAAE